MKKNSLTKNYIYNLAYQLLAIALPIITIPYISRTLGAENIGIYSYAISIAAYFVSFGSLGIALYGQREIAFKQDDKHKRSIIFCELFAIRIITLIFSLTVFYLLFVKGNQEYSLYYKILLLEIAGSAFDISWFYRGLEEFKKTVTRNIIVKIIGTILIFLLIKTKNDLPLYFLIYSVSTLVGNLSMWGYLPKYLTKIQIKDLHLKRHLLPIFSLFIPQVAVQIYTLLDKTMIGAMINDKSEVGYYDQSQKIIKILLTVITAFGTVMMPRIAYTFAKKDYEKICNYIQKSLSFVALLAFPLIAGIIATSDSFVPWFFGQGFEKVSLLMKIITPILLLIGVSNAIGTQYLLPTKQQKQYTTSVIIGAIINFIANMLLIPSLGALGASIGTILAELGVTLFQIITVRNVIPIKKIVLENAHYFLFALCILVIGLLEQKLLKTSLSTMIIQTISGILVYIGLLVATKDKALRLITKIWSKNKNNE